MNTEKTNWLIVSESNMETVAKMFKRDGFSLPSPRCFGKLVRSFDLTLRLDETRIKAKKTQWRLALDRIMSLLF